MNRFVLPVTFLATLALVSCGGGASSSSPQKTQEAPKIARVIVMSGQSPMEGSTFFDHGGTPWLRNAVAELEEKGHDEIRVDDFFVDEDGVGGIPEVQCSFRGYYPYESPIRVHASNVDDPMAGEFQNVRVGMGNKDEYMGPEIGLANVIRDYATEDEPIFLIKTAFSGSSFHDNNPPEYIWRVADDNNGTEGKLWTEAKEFIGNNLELIREMGFEPEMKAFLWHQGESDSSTAQYGDWMRHLLNEFREEYSDIAPSENGENIAFVDCTIYDGTRITYGGVDNLNKTKKAIAEESEMNFIINGSVKEEDGLNLEIGGNQNIGGCDGMYHYTTIDCFRLGEAYGNVLVENGIIE